MCQYINLLSIVIFYHLALLGFVFMDHGPAGAVQSQEQGLFQAAVQLHGPSRRLRTGQHPGLAELPAAEVLAGLPPELPSQGPSLLPIGLLPTAPSLCAVLALASFRQGIF